MKKFKSKRWKKPFAQDIRLEGDKLVAVISAKDLGLQNHHIYPLDALSLRPNSPARGDLDAAEFARSICMSNPISQGTGRDISPSDQLHHAVDCIFDRSSIVTTLGGPLYGEGGNIPRRLGEIRHVFIRRGHPGTRLLECTEMDKLIIQDAQEQLLAQVMEKGRTQSPTRNISPPVVRRPSHLKRKLTESHNDRTKSHYGE